MTASIYRRIIELVSEAADLARSVGIANLLQPGLVKEMIIAEILGHVLIVSKRDADAHAPGNPDIKYEYLSCKEGGSGQIDRVFRSPLMKRQQSLSRITRNTKIYLAIFYAEDQMRCKVIYELAPSIVLQEAERQLDLSQNEIAHVAFSESWAKQNGLIVYQNPG